MTNKIELTQIEEQRIKLCAMTDQQIEQAITEYKKTFAESRAKNNRDLVKIYYDIRGCFAGQAKNIRR